MKRHHGTTKKCDRNMTRVIDGREDVGCRDGVALQDQFLSIVSLAKSPLEPESQTAPSLSATMLFSPKLVNSSRVIIIIIILVYAVPFIIIVKAGEDFFSD